ncbi:hypothetical protein EV182_004372 [Spiromyces aspiralis]|uniref:Uncharacterized protein n=1 Tax=Spiromyces aspiralis TaxID=68401 RepID=A0ACC1HPZ9_9FUNG|nr:hypothetical protein EV182_004372 [Spiromyces aspiralis]
MGKAKYLTLTATDSLPDPTPTTPIARVLALPGQHLFAVDIPRTTIDQDLAARLGSMEQWADPSSTKRSASEAAKFITILVQLPPRYRNVIYVKRGRFVLVDLSDPLTNKIGGEVVGILLANHIKEFKRQGKWQDTYRPQEFASSEPKNKDSGNYSVADAGGSSSEDENDDDNDDDLLRANTNRIVHHEIESDTESDDE